MDLPEHLAIGHSRSYRPIPAVLGAEGEWEGGAILREITSPVGLFLFGTIRDVMLWLLLPPNRRAATFSTSGGDTRRAQLAQINVPSELYEPLAILLSIWDEPACEAEVSAGCLAIAEWARGSGALYSELAFRQAAALAHAEDVQLSLATARLARDLSQPQRAETWFRRTIKLARLKKEWESYIRAYLGLGTMYNRVGNGPAAKAVMERGLNAARRWRLHQLAGEAHHDLFHVWADLGNLRQAYEHASAARACYTQSPDHLFRLAADLGILSIKVGAPGRAIPLLQLAIPRIPDSRITALLLAWLTRAAAESHNRRLYEEAREDFFTKSRIGDLWRKVECHSIIAHSDVAMAEWERARQEAVVTLNLAEQISYSEYQIEAETILHSIASADPASSLRKTTPPETPGIARMADGLADGLCEAVQS